MFPIPKLLFELYVKLWGEKTAKVFFFPAPLGMM